jgi:hypothetical protein
MSVVRITRRICGSSSTTNIWPMLICVPLLGKAYYAVQKSLPENNTS